MSYIWDQGFTVYDKQVIEGLRAIKNALYEHLENEGRFHIDWGGKKLSEYQFGNWSFENEDKQQKAKTIEHFQSRFDKKKFFEYFSEIEDISFGDLIDFLDHHLGYSSIANCASVK